MSPILQAITPADCTVCRKQSCWLLQDVSTHGIGAVDTPPRFSSVFRALSLIAAVDYLKQGEMDVDNGQTENAQLAL